MSAVDREPISKTPAANTRKRVPHVKSRTGCTTCRTRRVKCDQTRPSCLRCIKFWGRCEGYAPIERKASRTKVITIAPSPSKIAPRPSQPYQNTVQLLQPPSNLRFTNQQEACDFQTFASHVASQLSGVFTSTLWSTVMLQASHSEPFVHDAVVALGALHSCGRRLILVHDTSIANTTGTKVSSSGIEVTPHYRFALQQWGHALQKMQARITEAGDESIRMGLIACLLVVCFENLQGSYFQGIKHALGGCAMLQTWLARQKEKQKKKEGKNGGRGAAARARREGITSPAPHIVEDELVQAFGRLDLQIMTYLDPRDASTHQELKNEGIEAVRHMPEIFTSIDDARNYWELVQRRTSHFIGTIGALARQHGTKQEVLQVDIGSGSGDGNERVTTYPESEILLSLPAAQAQAVRDECMQYRSEIQRWFAAFTPLYACLAPHTRAWAAAGVLRVQAQTSEIMLLASLFGDEFSLDNFTATFREVVAVGQSVAEDRLFQETDDLFVFDAGLVNPVRLVAKWCREPAVRRDAIALLRKLAVREGGWDALNMARITEYVMHMEEEGMDENGCIPRGMRVRITGMVIDDLKRTATVSCTRLGGSREKRETVIAW